MAADAGDLFRRRRPRRDDRRRRFHGRPRLRQSGRRPDCRPRVATDQHGAVRGGGTGRGRIRSGESALFYDVLYERLGHVQIGLGATALVLLFALLWPTFLMGASLPLLARGLTNDVRRAASTVGWLYGVNTLGAAAGAVGTTWLLLPQAGITGTVRVAALLNIACAAAAIALALIGRSRSAGPDTAGGDISRAGLRTRHTASAEALRRRRRYRSRRRPVSCRAAFRSLRGLPCLRYRDSSRCRWRSSGSGCSGCC